MRYSYFSTVLVKPTVPESLSAHRSPGARTFLILRAYQDMYRFYRQASSVCYDRNERYMARTQDMVVGLGRAKPLGERARLHRGYPAVSYLFVLGPGSGAGELTGCQPTQRSR